MAITSLKTSAKVDARLPTATPKQLSEWLRLAKEATEQKDFAKACEWYEKYLGDQPDEAAVVLLYARVIGKRGIINLMCWQLQRAIDLLDPIDAQQKQEIAQIAFHFAKQSHAKLSPRYERNHPMYATSFGKRTTYLKQINEALEFAIRTAPVSEIFEYAVRTYDEELDEIKYFTDSPGFNFVIDFNKYPARADAIRGRREATIKALRARGQQYETQSPQQPRIQWNSITGEGKAGCGCLILIAVLSLTASACVFAVETGLR